MGERAYGGSDPFEGLQLDDDFVAGATVTEASAQERLARLARIDDAHRRLLLEHDARAEALVRDARRRRRRHGAGWVAVLAVMAVLGWTVTTRPALDGSRLLEDAHADVFRFRGEVTELPPPSDEVQDAPLGRPVPPPARSSSYEFMQRQPGGDAPVAYDPCRPVHVVVNERTAPPLSATLVPDALAVISRATGLRFVTDGSTDERPSPARVPYQPERYGERWAPVLIAWSDPGETPALAGDTAGLGGSLALDRDGARVYVTGTVVLDGPQLSAAWSSGREDASVRAVIVHELAHLVGLAHVGDDEQLMYPRSSGQVRLAAGDLTGLAELGRGRCFPGL